MTHGQRRAHAWIWIVLGPLLLIVLIGALCSRSPLPNSRVGSTERLPASHLPGNLDTRALEPAVRLPIALHEAFS